MNSMTGFGRGESQQTGIQCSVEIKTVNSRYCDINIRSPKVINPVEHIIRQLIQSTLHRGKVEVMVTVVENGNREKKFTVNSTLKDQIKDMLIREGFYKETDTIPVQAIMAISGDWVQFQEDVVDQSVLEAMVSEATTKALHALTDMRIVEGQHIQLDLLGRLEILLQVLNRIDNVKDVAVTAYRNYLLTKMKSYLEDLHADVSEERFLKEVAILSDKTDITEEIASVIEESPIETVEIRSALTCETRYGVCTKCYGRSMATGRGSQKGDAVGVIAAQSIGEPGTQLTLRTFHVGGTASNIASESQMQAKFNIQGVQDSRK